MHAHAQARLFLVGGIPFYKSFGDDDVVQSAQKGSNSNTSKLRVRWRVTLLWVRKEQLVLPLSRVVRGKYFVEECDNHLAHFFR